MNKHVQNLILAVLTLFLVPTWTPPGLIDSAVAQSDLPLVQPSNLVYQGSFRVPQINPESSSLNYGGSALAFNEANNSLYITGHDWYQLTAELEIPTIVNSTNINDLNTATLLQALKDPTEGTLSNINPPNFNPKKIGGYLVFDSKLIVSAFSFYDTMASQSSSHFARPLNLSTAGQVAGPVPVGTQYPGFVSGYMTPIPSEWQASFGNPAITGNCCLLPSPIQSNGPAASVFNPSQIGQVSPVPATPIVGYPVGHQLGPGETTTNPTFNLATKINGVAFPSGTRSVLFFGRHGVGTYCYETGALCGDPTDSSKGPHAYPYQYQVWAYDADDLVAVRNGTQQQYDVSPYAIWSFNLPFQDAADSRIIGGVAYDATNDIIYISQQCTDVNCKPIIHAFAVQVDPPLSSLHFEMTGSATQVAGSSNVMTITARDDDGDIATSYSGDKSITLSGPLPANDSTAPTCTDKNGSAVTIGTAMTLTFTNGTATCSLVLYRAEVTSVDATDGTLSSSGNSAWDLDVTVTAAAASGAESSITASPNPQEIGQTVTVTVQAIDEFQNQKSTGGDTITLAVSGANPNASLVVTDLANGSYQATYVPTATGTDVINGTVNGLGISKDQDGVSDGSFNELVFSYHFEVSGATSQVVGTPQVLTLQVRRNDGVLRASYSGDHQVILSGPGLAPDGTAPTCRDKNGVDVALGSATTLNFSGGQATCVLAVYRAEVTTVDADDGTYNSTGNASWDLDLTVTAGAGAGTESELSAGPNPGEVGSTVTVTLQARDAYGNAKATSGDVVTISVSGANNAGSLSVSYIGGGQYQGTYVPSATGSDQITSLINFEAVVNDTDGLSDGTFNETVNSYHLEVTGSATQVAGSTQVVTIAKRRHDGSLDTSYTGSHMVTLSGPGVAPDGTVPTCSDNLGVDIALGTGTALLFASGEATCNLKLYLAETTSLDASDGTYSTSANSSWDLDIAVSAKPVDMNESTLDATPDPVESGNAVTVVVMVRDEYRNPRVSGTDVVTINVGGTNAVGALGVSYMGGGAYQGSYTPVTAGQDDITGTVNLVAITEDEDGVSDGVYELDVVAFHFEVTGSGTQEAGTSQVITLRVYDNGGVLDSSYTGEHLVTLSGPGVAPDGTVPTCRDKDGVAREIGLGTSLLFTNGEATCELTLYRAENTSVDVTDGLFSSAANSSWDLDVSVTPGVGAGAESEINSTPNPAEVGQTVTVILQARDAYGNAKTTGGEVVVLNVLGGNNPGDLSVSYLGGGQYQGNYVPNVTGTDQITGSINAEQVSKDGDGTSDGIYNEIILAYHLEVTGSATQVAGSTQVVTITKRRHDGAVDTSYTGDQVITLSGPLAAPSGTVPTCTNKAGVGVNLGLGTTIAFTNGQGSCSLRLYRAETTAVDASDGTYSSVGDVNWDLDVVVSNGAGAGTASILGASPNPAEIGNLVQISVTMQDTWGNVASSGSDSLSVSVSGANNVPVVTMTYDSAGIYRGSYQPSAAGTDTIQGLVNGSPINEDSDGTSDGVFHEIVNSYHLEVSGVSARVAGELANLTVTVRNYDATTRTGYQGLFPITLSGVQAALDGTIPTCLDHLGVPQHFGGPITINFVNGVGTCGARLYRVESASIDASDGTYSSVGDPAWDLDITVSAATVTLGRITANPNPAEVGQLVTLAVEARDNWGNLVGPGENVEINVGGVNTANGLIAVYVGSGVYVTSYTPIAPGEDEVTAEVNNNAVTSDGDGVSDGVYHEQVNAFHFEVSGSGTQVAGTSQVISIRVAGHLGVTHLGYSGNHDVVLSGPGASDAGDVPLCRDRNGVDVELGSQTSLAFNAGVASCALSLFRAETVAVDASDGTYSSSGNENWDLDVVVNADGGGIDAELSASPNPVELGQLVDVDVRASDIYGNELASSTEVSAAVSGGTTTSLVLSRTGIKTYSGSYTAQVAGEDMITALVSDFVVEKDTDGVSDGVYHLRVREANSGSYRISGRAYWREPLGEPVPGVLVGTGGQTVLTDGEGQYEIAGVNSGSYTISGAYEGYEVVAEAGVNPVTIQGGDVTDANLIVERQAPREMFAPWNGFLGNVVIGEVFNPGSKVLEVELTLYKMSGSSAGTGESLRYRVKPQEQVDVIVNDLKGFEEDRYGVLKFGFSSGDYSGQVSYYKLAPEGSFSPAEEGSEDFDYAFSNPFVGAVSGTSWLMYNTHQPSRKPEEARNLVPNWVTIINGENSGVQEFRIRKYDVAGKRVRIPDNMGAVSQLCKAIGDELRCRVRALARIDIDGGHVYPGPGNAGLIEISPQDENGKYVANLVRYGINAPPEVYSSRYNFAVQSQSRAGQGREQVLMISTGGDAENWLELANVLDESVRAKVEVISYTGELLHKGVYKLKPGGQLHLNAGAILGENQSGVARINGSKAGAVIAQSTSYYQNADYSVQAVRLSQFYEGYGRTRYGTYNRYLNSYNWLRLANTKKEGRTVKLILRKSGERKTYDVLIPGYGGVDLPLHETNRFGLEANTLGMIEVQDEVANGLASELLRIKPGRNSGFDFLMSSYLR